MHPEVRKRVAAIAADRERGASELARMALETLGRAAALSTATTVKMLRDDIAEATTALAAARPTMVVIANWVGRFQRRLAEAPPSDIAGLHQLAVVLTAELAAQSAEASRRVAERAAALLAPGDVVATCTHSSTVVATLALAQQQGKAPQCVVAESSFGGRSYGRALAEALAAHGVAARVAADAEIETAVAVANLAIIGADAVLGDGAVLNGVPSLRLARAAKAAGMPLYVVAESAKFTMSHIEPEAGFERVPPELIAAIVTESGLVAPAAAREVAQRWQ